MAEWDKIENLSLVANGLLHIQFEAGREASSYFRIAREAHQVLYRAMVEALKGSANFAITLRQSKEKSCQYQKGDDPWMEIHKVPPSKKGGMWRFSEPSACDPVVFTDSEREVDPGDRLIGFYDALAMIQTGCFMDLLTISKVIEVSDEDMRTLEWLHERIRNVYEHFIPQGYLAPVSDLCGASKVCLTLASRVLFESGNVLFFEPGRDELEDLFRDTRQRLDAVCNGSKSQESRDEEKT